MSDQASSRTVYEGKQFDVVVEEWSGRDREIVQHPGSTAIVAVDQAGFVTLVRQTREPAHKALVELPAGTLEPGEQALASAKRELAEEAGLSGGSWRELATFYTTPGFCDERMHLFLAEDLERGQASPDEDEDVEIVRWRPAEIEEHLDEIEDGKTLVGLLLYLRARNA